MFALIVSHLFAAGVGAGLVRALTLPKRQADGVAKVVDKATGAHLSGADVQGVNTALAGQAVNAVVAKEAGHEN